VTLACVAVTLVSIVVALASLALTDASMMALQSMLVVSVEASFAVAVVLLELVLDEVELLTVVMAGDPSQAHNSANLLELVDIRKSELHRFCV
jgi:hypothetical protein